MRTRATSTCNLQLPNAASLQRTDEVAAKIEKILADTPGVKYTTSVVGFSLLSFVRTSYNGFFFVTLKDWERPQEPGGAIPGDQAAPESGAGEASGRLRLQLLAAGDSRASALPADSPSCSKTAPARTSSSSPTI